MLYSIYNWVGELERWITPMKIGNYIKKIREESDLLQAQLADKADVSQTNLSHLERYNRMPKFDVVCRLCDALGITPTKLWENISGEYKIREGDATQQASDSLGEEGEGASTV